jgi:inner membrane protein
MDNLTHTLTGVMLARAGLNKFTPRATVLLVLAVNAPDIDFVSLLGGSAMNLEWHRGYTHAWACLPFLAAAVALLGKSLERNKPFPWWNAWVTAMIGVASHILLDWTNNYGVRFALPFNDHWYRLDTTFVIDPWIWAALLLCVAGPALSRLVSLEIGARKTSGAGAAWFALIFFFCYDTARYFLHERAIAMLSSRAFEGQTPKRVAAFPTPANPLRWRAIAELREGYWVSDLYLNQDFDPADGRIFFQAEGRPEIQAALSAPEFQSFVKFNQFPYWRVLPMAEPEGAQKVELYDMRFGDPSAPGFVASAIVHNGKSDQEVFRYGSPRL